MSQSLILNYIWKNNARLFIKILESCSFIDPTLKLDKMRKKILNKNGKKVMDDTTRPNGCHVHVWYSLVKYWFCFKC
jgi:hypothetical protein